MVSRLSMDRRWIPLLLTAVCLISSLNVLVSASEKTFYESFDKSFDGRWIASQKEDYKCVWKHENSEGRECATATQNWRASAESTESSGEPQRSRPRFCSK
jgi:hypothetical protein